MKGSFFFRLEDVGPTGMPQTPTSNRAELRAVVAVLGYMHDNSRSFYPWEPKNDSRLVIATDSAYVVDGTTNWVKDWETNGWMRRDGSPVQNQDLWKLLLEKARAIRSDVCEQLSFWHIPRELNGHADALARFASASPPRPRFGVPYVPGIMVDP